MGAGGSNIPEYDPSKDKCRPKLDLYLNCVKAKKDGLKEGDECLNEAQLYKFCRKEEKREILEKSLRDTAAEIFKNSQDEAHRAIEKADQAVKINREVAEKAIKDVGHEAEAALAEAKRLAEDVWETSTKGKEKK
jgi:hypothetical protein